MTHKRATQIFNELYDATYEESYSYILAKTGDIHRASEILNDSYTAIYQHLLSSKKDTIENKRAYLFTIIRHNLSNYYKENASPVLSIDDDASMDYNALIADELIADFNVQTQAEVKLLLDKILGFVSQKPELQRRAFVLRFLFDFKLSRIAKELSISEACAGNYIYRLVKELKEQFQAEYNNEQE